MDSYDSSSLCLLHDLIPFFLLLFLTYYSYYKVIYENTFGVEFFAFVRTSNIIHIVYSIVYKRKERLENIWCLTIFLSEVKRIIVEK